MSLSWRLSEIVNYENVCYHQVTVKENNKAKQKIQTGNMSNWYLVDKDKTSTGEAYLERMNPVTKCLIYVTMSVGMGSITDKNYKEFYHRVNLLERLQGKYFDDIGYIQLQDIEDHIRLYTNVSYESPTKWRNRVFKYVMENPVYQYKKTVSQMAKIMLKDYLRDKAETTEYDMDEESGIKQG